MLMTIETMRLCRWIECNMYCEHYILTSVYIVTSTKKCVAVVVIRESGIIRDASHLGSLVVLEMLEVV